LKNPVSRRNQDHKQNRNDDPTQVPVWRSSEAAVAATDVPHRLGTHGAIVDKWTDGVVPATGTGLGHGISRRLKESKCYVKPITATLTAYIPEGVAKSKCYEKSIEWNCESGEFGQVR